ncbi:MAG: ABC transporter permease [Pseudomonadota bacterium]|nr:ABC transporter permease [Pseudomonadota bacterium]
MTEFWSSFARNRAAVFGLVIVVLVIAVALVAPFMFDHAPLRMVARPQQWPFTNPDHILGTDSVGRDIAAMIAFGARNTLLVGSVAAATALAIGVVVGATAAYFGGWVDEALNRVTELFQTVPHVILIMTIIAVLGSEQRNMILGIGLVMWPQVARLTRAEFLSLRDREFVQACRTMGMGNARIMFVEILPNALPPIVVLGSLIVASAILFEAAVSFLGLADPNVASWGALIGDGRSLIRTSWYICAIPGLAIMFTVLALNLVGDGLNDALNPKLRDR